MRYYLRLISYAWLILGLPLFGIMPLLWLQFGKSLNHELVWFWSAVMMTIWTIFLPDPEPNSDHSMIPLTQVQWWFMVVTAGVLTSIALLYLIRDVRRRHSLSIGPEHVRGA